MSDSNAAVFRLDTTGKTRATDEEMVAAMRSLPAQFTSLAELQKAAHNALDYEMEILWQLQATANRARRDRLHTALDHLRGTNSAVLDRPPASPPPLALVRPIADGRDDAALRSVVAELGPPAGFTKGGGWTDEILAELLAQDEKLKRAGATWGGRQDELHKAWGYSKSADKNEGPLTKILTKARRARNAGQKRRKAG